MAIDRRQEAAHQKINSWENRRTGSSKQGATRGHQADRQVSLTHQRHQWIFHRKDLLNPKSHLSNMRTISLSEDQIININYKDQNHLSIVNQIK